MYLMFCWIGILVVEWSAVSITLFWGGEGFVIGKGSIGLVYN